MSRYPLVLNILTEIATYSSIWIICFPQIECDTVLIYYPASKSLSGIALIDLET